MWKKNNNTIVLSDTVDYKNIDCDLRCIDSSNNFYTKTSSLFLIPINTKEQNLYNTKIVFKSDSGYCLPSLDTCISISKNLDSFRAEFGFNFKTKWFNFQNNRLNKILIIAKIQFLPENYFPFSRRFYKLNGKYLKLIKSY